MAGLFGVDGRILGRDNVSASHVDGDGAKRRVQGHYCFGVHLLLVVVVIVPVLGKILLR